jgi:hydroxyacylglutathione hydrolase
MPVPIRSRLRLRRLAAAPPEPVADGVWLVRGGLTRTMNAYLVRDGGRVIVFDAGEKGMAGAIAAAAAPLGGIARLVLGHGDTDHRGSAPALRAAGVPVHCHPDAVAQAQGSGGRDYWDTSRLPPDVRLLHGFAHRFVWDGGPVTIDGLVREGDRVADFEVVELAGHAPGQIGLWRESDGVALVSDTFYCTDMHGRPIAPAPPPDAYNLDPAAARRAIAKLTSLRPRIVGPGHLGPLSGPELQAQLEAAARSQS